MNHSKSHSESAAASVKSTLTEGTRGINAGLDQATKNYDGALMFSKQAGEAMMRSTASINKTTEALRLELQTYSQQAANDTMAATRAIMGSKSMLDAFEIQTEFAKTAYEGFVAQASKINQLFVKLATEAFKPVETAFAVAQSK